jgi:hypothetical protein
MHSHCPHDPIALHLLLARLSVTVRDALMYTTAMHACMTQR